MSQFTITSIDRASDIDRTYQTLITGFGDDRVTLTNEVFNSNDDIPQEATEGQFPVAFLLDYSYVPLFVTGRFRFPRQSAYYQLEVNGPGMFKMTSGRFAVTGNVDGTSKEFTTTFFSIESPKAECPFRVAGDWAWTLRQTDGKLLATSAPTRLEIYFFLGKTGVPFSQEGHLLELIRLTIPHYELVAGLSWPQAEAALLKNMIANLWTLGGSLLRYDSHKEGGRMWFLEDGDCFVLEDMLYPTGRRLWCNCADLANLVQVAAASVGGKPDPEDQDSEVMVIDSVELHGESPWGYIHTGPLFGWDVHPTRKCNSPFWYPDLPCFMNRDDPSRTHFGTHVFAHFDRADGAVAVLDLTHGNLDHNNEVVLEAGQHDVTTYRRETKDQGDKSFSTDRVIRHYDHARRVQYYE